MRSHRGTTLLLGSGVAALALGAAVLPRGGNDAKPAANAVHTASRPVAVRTSPTSSAAAPATPVANTARVSRDAATAADFSPYVDVGLYPPFDLTGTARRSGVRTFTLAFVVSGGACEPTWAGSQALADNEVARQIEALRAAGGDVRVSFGGQAGTELAQACDDADRLAAAYRKVIDAFSLTKVDFDVEGAALTDTAAGGRRDEAIATLQKQVKGLDVSFTLPVLPTGLTADGVRLVTDARKKGVDVSTVNIMAMDYGDGAAPDPDGHMGDLAIEAARSTEAQLRTALDVDDAFARLAVTPMIGVGDIRSEVFTVDDARKLAAFARDEKLAWLSMWSAVRDRQCPGGPAGSAEPTCSGVAQDSLAFTRALAGEGATG